MFEYKRMTSNSYIDGLNSYLGKGPERRGGKGSLSLADCFLQL